MLNRLSFSKWLMMGVVLVVAVAPSSQTNWAQEDKVVQLQQTIDAADRRIREIVRELAKPGLAAARRAELIREKENQERARSQAQWALYKEREEQRRDSADVVVPRFKAEMIAWQDAAEAWAKEWRNFERDLRIHQQDLQEHRQALAEFERLPPSQQTQTRADQLNDWAQRGNARRDRLITWHQALDRKRVELMNRYRSLEDQVLGER
jgi:hypothetical protein